MREHFVTLIILLSVAIWLSAQNPTSVTAVGCVATRPDGGYVLNTNDKHYQLAGSDIPFAKYVGQKVQAVGTESWGKKPGTNGKAENMVIRADSPTLTVSKMEKLADTCKDSH